MSKNLQTDQDIVSFSKMVDFIKHNYARNISVDDIARAGNVCRTKCFSLFKIFKKESPKDYLNDARLEQSRELLNSSVCSVTEICSLCGFKSRSHFSKSFQKRYGISPSDFKKESHLLEPSKEKTLMMEALLHLSYYFYKIIKMDLKKDTYTIIKQDLTDRPTSQSSKTSLTKWIKEFAESPNLHPDDKEAFKEIHKVDFLRNYFKKTGSAGSAEKRFLRLKYRRLVGKEFKWVALEIIPSENFSSDCQIIYIYIRDIHDEMEYKG